MRKDIRYFDLFKATFFLSAFTFGGGYVMVPLMKKKFSEQLQWIDEQEMLDLVAIGQSSPGAIAINTSILVGFKMKGIPGAFVALLGTVLPPLIIISSISFFYEQFRQNTTINNMLLGMQAGVACIIIDVVIKMADSVIKVSGVFSIFIMSIVFFATFYFKVNVGLIILCSALLGLLIHYCFLDRRKNV